MGKAKILITAMSMNIGGAEKSLVNLLNLIDYSEMDVSLLLFQRRGKLLPQVPKEVSIISVPEIDVLYGGMPSGCLSATKALSLRLRRYEATGITRLLERQFDRRRLRRWTDFYSQIVPELPGEYDCAVSYSGGETFWYAVEKVSARRKVVYYHSDYSNIDIDAAKENAYLDHADSIVTISDKCAESLRRIFPRQTEKVKVIQNPSSERMLRKMAREAVEDGFRCADGALKIISVGRLHPVKGFDLAVEAASLLVKTGISDFEWLIVGDGEQRKHISRRIAHEALDDVFRLLGEKSNPYPYIAAADILVQPSRFEGKSVVLDEARVFGIPAVVTRYPSAEDQVQDGINGLLVEISADGLANGIQRLLSQPGLLDALRAGAALQTPSNLDDISEFNRLVMG